MIELKRENVHKIVLTEEQAQNLIYQGYERVTSIIIEAAPKEAKIEDYDLTIEKIEELSFLEMKEIAKALKIKGYTNMGKSFLQKALKELV